MNTFFQMSLLQNRSAAIVYYGILNSFFQMSLLQIENTIAVLHYYNKIQMQ